MTIELDDDVRKQLKETLCSAFPDADIDDADVEGFSLALQRGIHDLDPKDAVPAELSNLDLSGCQDQLSALSQTVGVANADAEGVVQLPKLAADKLRYYWVEATHIRKDPSGYAPFVGKLAMVRATLPAREPRRFVSAIGTLEPADHLISTVYEANDKYASALGYPLKRLDVITPPRQLLRFGAISVLLGYRDPAAQPTCYILEAGTATGQPRVLYLGKTMDTMINRRSGYKPTEFSCPDNAYTGTLTLSGDSPSVLHITARDIMGNVSKPKYMDMTARFSEQRSNIKHIWPGLLIARAATIVLARRLRGLTNTCEDT